MCTRACMRAHTHTKKTTSRQVIIKLLKTNDKEKILKVARGNKQNKQTEKKDVLCRGEKT